MLLLLVGAGASALFVIFALPPVARDLPQAVEQRWATTMAILRDADFQHLLTNYPRARSPFLIAETKEDYVVSGYLIRTSDGRTVQPDDYLKMFEQYVRDNPDHVEAIRILLERPAHWRTDALRELRQTLQARPEGFNEQRLRRAYHHELADIISLVKHAATGEPLMSAQERVEHALAKVLHGRTLTAQQQQWMDLIRRHLIANLTIERQDVEQSLEFEREGATWRRVNADFDGQLESLLNQLNEAVAA